MKGKEGLWFLSFECEQAYNCANQWNTAAGTTCDLRGQVRTQHKARTGSH